MQLFWINQNTDISFFPFGEKIPTIYFMSCTYIYNLDMDIIINVGVMFVLK